MYSSGWWSLSISFRDAWASGAPERRCAPGPRWKDRPARNRSETARSAPSCDPCSKCRRTETAAGPCDVRRAGASARSDRTGTADRIRTRPPARAWYPVRSEIRRSARAESKKPKVACCALLREIEPAEASSVRAVRRLQSRTFPNADGVRADGYSILFSTSPRAFSGLNSMSRPAAMISIGGHTEATSQREYRSGYS